MTPADVARHFAAGLIERQLSAAHIEGPYGDLVPGRDCGIARARMVLETFDDAPPVVAAALAKMTDAERERVTEEMARLADQLRQPETRP